MRTLTLAFLALASLLAACGGSTLDVAPGADDGGGDVSTGDSSGLDVASDSRGDTTTGDVGTDTTPPPIDGGTDTMPPPVDGGGSDATPDVRPDSGGGACGPSGACAVPLSCCSGACVYQQNDPLNCGGCGVKCSGETSMCSGARCVKPTCSPACGDGSVCCNINGPGPIGPPKCVAGTTCPIGCPLCV